MATLHGTAKRVVELSAAKGKGKEKRKESNMDVDEVVDESQPPKKRRNKQRVLMLSSRGVTHRMRHLMNDLETLLPHVKKGARCPDILLLAGDAHLLLHRPGATPQMQN
jgi:ribosome biogenesis protein BRX1